MHDAIADREPQVRKGSWRRFTRRRVRLSPIGTSVALTRIDVRNPCGWLRELVLAALSTFPLA